MSAAANTKVAESSPMSLSDGSRIAVVGGGPAGSLFSYFALGMAQMSGLAVDLDIYEPKDFTVKGPKCCNMCGGIISESLVQMLAAEGILLPDDVVQRGIDAYMLHTDAGTIRIDTPAEEKRIASVFRGGGPHKSPATKWRSFDGYLLSLALEKGAKQLRETVKTVTADGDKPQLKTAEGIEREYDLVVVAAGVNTQLAKSISETLPAYSAPETTKTIIREYDFGTEKVSAMLGDTMHLFLMNVDNVKFAAAIPKGRSVTLCMLGKGVGRNLLANFLGLRAVQDCLPGIVDQACGCAPRMSISPAKNPFRDRIVFVGDCGVSRLYKDGIGAAYRQAKAAASTVIFRGLSESDFKREYKPALDAITNDNRYGHIVFMVTSWIQRFTFAQRAILAMVHQEQSTPHSSKRMSSVLWDAFTGSAPYRDIFFRTLQPAFWLVLTRYLITSLIRPRSIAHNSRSGT